MYCGSCGTQLNPGARFCRACGRPQAAGVAAPPPPPPSPFPPGARQPAAPAIVVAAVLACAGGLTYCLLTLYATIYEPLHYEYPVNFGESIQFGDALAFVAGAAAVALGLLLYLRPGNNAVRGLWLVTVGLPTLVLGVLWPFPGIFDDYSRPFHFGFVYYAEFGHVLVGSHFLQLPLMAAGAMIVAAGILAVVSPQGRPVPSVS